MSKFILNDDGKVKEVSSMEKPDYAHYAGFRRPQDVYVAHMAEYEQHLASLRSYQASPELLATMKVGDVVDEGEIMIHHYSNGDIVAYPRAKEGTGDDVWSDLLNALGFGFIGREKLIVTLKSNYHLTRKI